MRCEFWYIAVSHVYATYQENPKRSFWEQLIIANYQLIVEVSL